MHISFDKARVDFAVIPSIQRTPSNINNLTYSPHENCEMLQTENCWSSLSLKRCNSRHDSPGLNNYSSEDSFRIQINGIGTELSMTYVVRSPEWKRQHTYDHYWFRMQLCSNKTFHHQQRSVSVSSPLQLWILQTKNVEHTERTLINGAGCFKWY